jgi:hypothetical protein
VVGVARALASVAVFVGLAGGALSCRWNGGCLRGELCECSGGNDCHMGCADGDGCRLGASRWSTVAPCAATAASTPATT